MLIESYIQIVDDAISLSAEDKRILSEHLKEFKLNKKEYFTVPGDPPSKFGFVFEGLARMYLEDEKGDQNVTCFIETEYYIGDFMSLAEGVPTDRYIQAISDVKGVMVDLKSLVFLQSSIPRFKNFMDDQFQMAMLRKNRLQRDILSNEAAEAYEIFIKQQPQAATYAPQRHVASFLGVTEYSLSRIKRELRKRNKD